MKHSKLVGWLPLVILGGWVAFWATVLLVAIHFVRKGW